MCAERRKKPGPKVKFTEALKAKFCEHLAEWGAPTIAADHAGVAYETARRHRETDEEFAAAWEEALIRHHDSLVKEATERARDGYVERPMFDRDGQHVGDVLKKSDGLMTLFLKRGDPSFRETVKVDQRVEHTGTVRSEHVLDLTGLAPEVVERIAAVLREATAIEIPACAEAGPRE